MTETQPVTFLSLFSTDAIVADLAADNIDGAFDELLAVLGKSKKLGPTARKQARAAFTLKLEQGATGAVGHSVAVPHVKIPGARSTVVALGRSERGIDFRAGDGTLVNLCFLVITAENKPEEHLDFLRWIASLARDPDFPRFARGCQSSTALYDLLEEMTNA